MKTLRSTEAEWTALWKAFHQAVEAVDGGVRSRVLGGLEPRMRREVEELLAAHEARGGWLATPVPRAEQDDSLLGREVGAYRPLRLLGKGGMGAVYLAEQVTPIRRLVALKVVRNAQLPEEAIRRFQAERQILVMMNHPNVATAYDAGTISFEGRELPWLAMEWVAGLPIDIFCDRFLLDVEARMELLHQVLRGVAHAHRRGIVHRDLKELNLLVTVRDGEAVAKVIDFGIAKSLGAAVIERPAETHLGLPIGTPGVMSPEQAAGDVAIEATSDVYSLGLLAYRLLVGVGPDAVAEDDGPLKPSACWAALSTSERERIAIARSTSPAALGKWLVGVDEALVRALALDPTRRYDDAGSFAVALEQAVHTPSISGGRWRRWGLAAMLLIAFFVGLLVLRGSGSDGGVTSGERFVEERLVEDPSALQPASGEVSVGGPLAAISRPSARRGETVPLAVTFDDLPGSKELSLAELDSLTADLLARLAERQVLATGFVNSDKLEVAGEVSSRTDFLRRWLDAGHGLGNHGARHLSLNDVEVDEYLRDIEAGAPVLRQLLGERGESLRWFRHPYLRAGKTREAKEAVDTWLAARGYAVAAVTLENTDWMFASVYRRRLEAGDEEGAKEVAAAYLEHSERLFSFLETASESIVGAQHPHILLLHINRLNADYFDALADLLEARGYRYAALEEVFADPVYARPDNYFGPYGVVWQYRWSHTEGNAFAWEGEPEPPQWILDLFRRRGP